MNNKHKILVCINDLSFAKRVKTFLEEQGLYVFGLISSGDELIRDALDYYPSLIISDITLRGEIDGIEAISRLSGILKIPYIFLAEEKEDVNLIKSYFLNPLETFTKPVDIEELHSRIVRYVDAEKETFHSDYYLG